MKLLADAEEIHHLAVQIIDDLDFGPPLVKQHLRPNSRLLAKQQGKGHLVGCPLPVLRSAFFELDGRAYGLPDENISGEFEPSTQLPHLF